MRRTEFVSVSFYSLHRDNTARLHVGFTDGKFNYYQSDLDYWFAIDPACGVAVCRGATLEEAAVSANSTKVWHDVQKFKENGQYARWEDRFRKELEVLGLSPASGPVLPLLDSIDLLFGEGVG